MITGITPSAYSQAGHTAVTISGQSLVPAGTTAPQVTVLVAGVPVSALTSVSPTTIVATLGASATEQTGPVTITTATYGENTSPASVSFTYVNQNHPLVSSIASVPFSAGSYYLYLTAGVNFTGSDCGRLFVNGNALLGQGSRCTYTLGSFEITLGTLPTYVKGQSLTLQPLPSLLGDFTLSGTVVLPAPTFPPQLSSRIAVRAAAVSGGGWWLMGFDGVSTGRWDSSWHAGVVVVFFALVVAGARALRVLGSDPEPAAVVAAGDPRRRESLHLGGAVG